MKIILANICGDCIDHFAQSVFDRLNTPFIVLIVLLLIFVFIKSRVAKFYVASEQTLDSDPINKDVLMQTKPKKIEHLTLPFSGLSRATSFWGLIIILVSVLSFLYLSFIFIP